MLKFVFCQSSTALFELLLVDHDLPLELLFLHCVLTNRPKCSLVNAIKINTIMVGIWIRVKVSVTVS